MAFTAEQLAELEAAYAAGVTTVHHADKSVTYGSLEELWAAILRIRRALRAAAKRYRGGVVGYSRYT